MPVSISIRSATSTPAAAAAAEIPSATSSESRLTEIRARSASVISRLSF